MAETRDSAPAATERWLAAVADVVRGAHERGASADEIERMYAVRPTESRRIARDAKMVELHRAGLNDREIADAMNAERLTVYFRRKRLGLKRNASPGRQRGEPAVLAIAAALMVLAGGAQAQQQACGKAVDIAAELAAKYGEVQVAAGLSATNKVVAVYASADGKTWTILAGTPDGTACIMSAGSSWEAIAPKPVGAPT